MNGTGINLNEAITRQEQLFRRQLGAGISLQITPATEPAGIGADEAVVGQIVAGLLELSRNMLSGGGAVTIQLEHFEVDETHARIQPDARRGKFIRLTIGDNGAGMRPENLQQLLEQMPAKPRGDFLALPRIASILQHHRGWIEAVSQERCGTAFRLYWPVVAVKSTPTKPPRGHDTILLVDDEAAIRQMVKGVLERASYNVIEAESGAQALALWEAKQNCVDLLLTDMVMPDGVTGRNLAQRLKQSKPGLKVIYTSGYELDAEALQDTRDRKILFLHKPYDTRSLLETVHAAMAGPVETAETASVVIAA